MNMKSDLFEQDPLGLRRLPLLDPDYDDWPEIRQALVRQAQSRRRWKQTGGWLAAAATVVLALGVATRQQLIEQDETPGLAHESAATQDTPITSSGYEDPLPELIALSQLLEQRLRGMRAESGALPAQSLVYIAELEDMIARVDGELSSNPASVDLWGQRVNLMLDLELIFQHHWEREYGRMASR